MPRFAGFSQWNPRAGRCPPTAGQEAQKRAKALTDDPIEFLVGDDHESLKALRAAISVAWDPTAAPISRLQESYQLLGWWYAKAKDKKRRAKHSSEDPDYIFSCQAVEDLMEALVRGMDRALMVRMHLNKLGGT